MFSISTVASSTRMPTASASPPSVIRLIVCPEARAQGSSRHQCQRNVEHHHDELRQSRRKSEHHQAGENGAQQPFGHDADMAGHVRRLIELEASTLMSFGKSSCISGRLF